ncbi:MAG: glycosyltransferase family 4 protein [Myxococcota bacterium]|nr:glycosyltransferase family 4 protein [Myxococcota bacterium]
MPRRRLLHIATVPETLYFLRGQVQFMRDAGFDVHVATAPGARLQGVAEECGAEPHELPLTRAISPRADLVATRRTHALIRALRPDVVHGHTPKGGLVSMMAAAAARVPVRIYHLRGMPLLTAEGATRAALWGAEATSITCAHRVIAVSRSLAAAARAHRLPVRRKVSVIGAGSSNGVDLKRFDPTRRSREEARRTLGLAGDETVFAYVGRLVADKGIPELVDAWRRVTRDDGPPARLLMVGTYEARDGLDPETRRHIETSPSIEHRPFMEDIATLYRGVDALVLPTRREGFPNVPLEAAAMELPVVTTDAIGAVDSVVHDATGLIAPTGSAAGLADAITRYLRDPDLRRRHGRAGRERAERDFQPERIWSGILEIYQRELARVAS